MSHELRTPLHAVLGFTELVREDLASASDAARFESAIDDLDRVIQASNPLVGIIADILDLTKLESGALELRDEDIDIATPHPEFDRWQWMTPEALTEKIVPFKRPVYAEVFAAFAERLRRG